MKHLLRRDLQELQVAYTRPKEPSGLVRAHMNEMTDDWPPLQKAEWVQALGALNLGLYPEQQATLTRRIETRLGAAAGSALLGPSSGALLDLLALVGLEAGDVVAVPSPGFSLYALLIKRARGSMALVEVGAGMPLSGFLKAAMAGAKQLWITTPNNPTGALADPDELYVLCTEIGKLEAPPLVVIDEAYCEFAPRTARLLVEAFPFVILLRTFSKALGSAGLRLGYVLGTPALVSALAALQLPYSISAPALCALDVALASPAPFEDTVRATIDRRTRLVEGLKELPVGVVDVSSSAANFLYLKPSKVSELLALGVLARALPGSEYCRVSLSDERAAEAVAIAYGATLPKPNAAALRKRTLLVLDVDGVLIEAEASFRTAVAKALLERFPALPWEDGIFRTMKRVAGMNNDFRLAAAVGWLWEEKSLASDSRFDALLRGVAPAFNASELASIDANEAILAPLVRRHYGSTQVLEHALIDLRALHEISEDCAIFTGRDPHELNLAQDTLGFSLPAVCDRGPHLRKPQGAGLLLLRDAFRADRILFVGDTHDDYAALKAAQRELGHVEFAFCAVGAFASEIVPSPDSNATFAFRSLRDALPSLRSWTKKDDA
jgi:histidinol-phosphate/aromatic aminotransferase/cobyric acid decarboxylase-like protein/phosphoglycolate phosphatase-like HAD superfamily hydrolase